MARFVEEPLASGADSAALDRHRGRRRPRVRGPAVHHRGPRRPGAGRLRGLRARSWPALENHAAPPRGRAGHRRRAAAPPSGAARPWATTCSTSRSPSGAAGGCSASRASPARSCAWSRRSRGCAGRSPGRWPSRSCSPRSWPSRCPRRWRGRCARSWTPRAASPPATSPRASRVDRADEMGELARILNHSADQLQARLTEVARERARADAILSSMEEGLLAVDHQGTVLLANESLLPRALACAIPRAVTTWRRCASARWRRSSRRSCAPGERREAEVHVHHLRRVLRAGRRARSRAWRARPHGAVVTFHDITDRRRVEQIRRDFVANASHELRTPLTSIRGFVEALEDGALTEPAQRPALPGQDPHPRGADGGAGGRPARAVAPGVRGARRRAGSAWRPWRSWRTWSPRWASLAASQAGDALRPRRRRPRGRDRRRAAAPDPREPRGERDQVHARRAARSRSTAQDGGRRRGHRRPGRRPRHRRRAPAADLRALLPGGQGAQPRHRRHRPGPRHRAPPRGEHRRHGDGDERARARVALRGDGPARAA